MIDINKQYRTRDGREVRIYATDGDGDPSTHGAIKDYYRWSAAVWKNDGKCLWSASSFGEPSQSLDLIEVPPRHKRTVWLIMWSSNYIQVMNTPEWQISTSGRSGEVPYACIKVELDFEEGEGL